MTAVHITAAQAVTAIGLTVASTAASVHAGLRRTVFSEVFPDENGSALFVAPLPKDEEESTDRFDRVAPAAIHATRLLLRSFDAPHDQGRPCHLLLGCSHPDRVGVLVRHAEDLLPTALTAELSSRLDVQSVQLHPRGNPAALFALDAARTLLAQDRRAVCVIAGMDSLLDEDLLEHLEDQGRLESERRPNPRGMCPGEAVGVLAVEAADRQTPRRPLAVVEGVSVGHEPHPYTSERPSQYEGLTMACRGALLDARVTSAELDAVVLDLNGEHHRAHEWATVERRCLGRRTPPRQLVVPGRSYGTIGAASAAVQLAIVAASRGWLDGLDLVLASDDDGPCGAAVLRRQWKGH